MIDDDVYDDVEAARRHQQLVSTRSKTRKEKVSVFKGMRMKGGGIRGQPAKGMGRHLGSLHDYDVFVLSFKG